MHAYLLIALGGALGSVLRFAIAGAVGKLVGESFPWGTLIVNVSGSLLIGIFAAVARLDGKLDADARLMIVHLLMIGLCGGYTTFSTFSLQTLSLFRAGDYLAAGVNIALSTTFCLLATAFGFWIGLSLSPDRAA